LQSKKHAEREKNTLTCVFLKGSVGRLKSSDKFNTAEKHEVTVYTFVRIHFSWKKHFLGKRCGVKVIVLLSSRRETNQKKGIVRTGNHVKRVATKECMTIWLHAINFDLTKLKLKEPTAARTKLKQLTAARPTAIQTVQGNRSFSKRTCAVLKIKKKKVSKLLQL